MTNIAPALPQMRISLREVKCVLFEETEYGKTFDKTVPADGYEFEFNLQLKIEESKQFVSLLLITKLFEKSNPKILICTLISSTGFWIESFSDIMRKNDKNEFLVPDKFIEIGSSITLANTRGMFAIKLENTKYNNAVIPLMDSKAFLQKKPI